MLLPPLRRNNEKVGPSKETFKLLRLKNSDKSKLDEADWTEYRLLTNTNEKLFYLSRSKGFVASFIRSRINEAVEESLHVGKSWKAV